MIWWCMGWKGGYPMSPADSSTKRSSAKRDATRLVDAAILQQPPSKNPSSLKPSSLNLSPIERSGVFNETRNAMLHPAPAYAATPLSQAIGLMFARGTGSGGHCVVFAFSEPKRDLVSMFFVREPIDILLLDEDSRVIGVRERLRPWRMWLLPVRASYMVELPAGTIQSSKTLIGDAIVLPDPDRCIHMWTLREYVLFFAFQAGVFVLLLAIAAGIMLFAAAIRTITW